MVPCLLYLEKRMSEAMTTHLLLQAVCKCHGNGASTDQLKSGVVHLLNEFLAYQSVHQIGNYQ
jgi:hypothetical protein